MPHAAVTSGGMGSVSSGSITAMVGRSRAWLIPDFTLCLFRSMMHTGVASAPVPAVVGTATSGPNGPSGPLPPPIGGLTDPYATTLEHGIGLPPAAVAGL